MIIPPTPQFLTGLTHISNTTLPTRYQIYIFVVQSMDELGLTSSPYITLTLSYMFTSLRTSSVGRRFALRAFVLKEVQNFTFNGLYHRKCCVPD